MKSLTEIKAGRTSINSPFLGFLYSFFLLYLNWSLPVIFCLLVIFVPESQAHFSIRLAYTSVLLTIPFAILYEIRNCLTIIRFEPNNIRITNTLTNTFQAIPYESVSNISIFAPDSIQLKYATNKRKTIGRLSPSNLDVILQKLKSECSPHLKIQSIDKTQRLQIGIKFFSLTMLLSSLGFLAYAWVLTKGPLPNYRTLMEAIMGETSNSARAIISYTLFLLYCSFRIRFS